MREIITDNQRKMMEGFVQMMSPVLGKENCQKWYEEFLDKDISELKEMNKRVDEFLENESEESK